MVWPPLMALPALATSLLEQGPPACRPRECRPPAPRAPAPLRTANLRTTILDFRGFDSSTIRILRGGILRSKGNFWESLSQQNLSRDNLSRKIGRTSRPLGWHYLSNDTCLIRPRLLCAFFVVSRITIISCILRHFRRKQANASDKWC